MSRSPAELERVAVAVAQQVGDRLGRVPPGPSRDGGSAALVRALLLGETPGAGVSGPSGGAVAGPARVQWVVGPLAEHPATLVVSLAAAVDGQVCASAVLDVARAELFSARRGEGARLAGRPLAPSACARLEDAVVGTGFAASPALREQQGGTAHRLLARARDLRCLGSTALSLCWVAAGRLDAYYEHGSEVWDHLAGVLVAEEAGAACELPTPESDDLLTCSPPELGSALRGAVAGGAPGDSGGQQRTSDPAAASGPGPRRL